MHKAVSYSGYNPNDYKIELVWVSTSDGVTIPVSLVYHKDLVLDGSNPLLLEAYGSYGINTYPSISIAKISLLKRGFIYAIAHVRGSSMLGQEWHEQGQLLNKKNTIDDYIASAKFLIEENYTASKHLFGVGGSAGGMLMGAVANKSGALFKGFVLEYPAVCMLDWLEDDKNVNIEEFGDVINDVDAFSNVLSYAPYINVKQQVYPTMLFISGYNNLRVPYWNATKMVARLREQQTHANPILLRTYNSGHIGGSSRYSFYNEMAFEYTFVLSLFDR